MSVDAKELRIGNLVSHSDYGNIFGLVVTLNSDNGIETQYSDFGREENLLPIPLTTEILLKCGFENDLHTHWLEYSIDGSVSYISLTCGNYHWLYDNQLSNIDNYPRRIIQYLHQLQNLYRCLVGKELEINLTL